jgi:hypothetical protein
LGRTRAPLLSKHAGGAKMFRRLFVAGATCLILFAPIHSQPIPSLDNILKEAGNNIRIFEETLPDFLCREVVTQKVSRQNELREEKIIESIFRGFQKPDKEKHMTFTELREIKSVNGRPIGDKRSNEIGFDLQGGFSSLIIMTFSTKYQALHNYKIDRIETIQGRQVLAVKFSTKKGQEGIRQLIMGNSFINKDEGKAWLDLESLQVIRIERRFLNVPAKFSSFTIRADYDKVLIADQAFWMPKLICSESTEKKNNVQRSFIARYSEYQKFDSSVQMKFSNSETEAP